MKSTIVLASIALLAGSAGTAALASGHERGHVPGTAPQQGGCRHGGVGPGQHQAHDVLGRVHSPAGR